MKIGLFALDSKLNLFAEEVGALISKDETKGMWLPDKFEGRTLNWKSGDFEYSIAIYPIFKNDQIRKWAFGAWCVCKRDQQRFSANRIFIETRKISNIVASFDSLLLESKSFLNALKFDDLVPD